MGFVCLTATFSDFFKKKCLTDSSRYVHKQGNDKSFILVTFSHVSLTDPGTRPGPGSKNCDRKYLLLLLLLFLLLLLL